MSEVVRLIEPGGMRVTVHLPGDAAMVARLLRALAKLGFEFEIDDREWFELGVRDGREAVAHGGGRGEIAPMLDASVGTDAERAAYRRGFAEGARPEHEHVWVHGNDRCVTCGASWRAENPGAVT